VKLGETREVDGTGLGVPIVIQKGLPEELLYILLLLNFVNLVIKEELPDG